MIIDDADDDDDDADDDGDGSRFQAHGQDNLGVEADGQGERLRL